jgi:CRISPR/Cas system CSM-associated protein Csm3 (group 7 of RAMP superfamily)
MVALCVTCPTCRVFGSPYVAAKARFTDAPLHGDTWLGTEIRDGVGIERDTRTARAGIKYDFEAVPAGTSFKLQVSLDNVEPAEVGMVLMGFDLLDKGIARLGGIKSRGLGRVRVQWNGVEEWDARAALRGTPKSRIGEGTAGPGADVDAQLHPWIATAQAALADAVVGSK